MLPFVSEDLHASQEHSTVQCSGLIARSRLIRLFIEDGYRSSMKKCSTDAVDHFSFVFHSFLSRWIDSSVTVSFAIRCADRCAFTARFFARDILEAIIPQLRFKIYEQGSRTIFSDIITGSHVKKKREEERDRERETEREREREREKRILAVECIAAIARMQRS